MNILLVGYGKMGKAIEPIAISHGHEIAGKVDLQTGEGFTSSIRADVAIEFTGPEVAFDNVIQRYDMSMVSKRRKQKQKGRRNKKQRYR